MASQYFKYITTYGNTIVDRSSISFAPSPPYGELYIDYFIPEIQPLYLYRVTGSTIVVNLTQNIEQYLKSTTPPPTPDDYVKALTITGYTASTNSTFKAYTGTTAPATYVGKITMNTYSANTLTNINNRVFRSGDTMTGTLRTTSNLLASGAVTGSSICGSVWVNSPLICGSTKVQSPILTGSTCSIAPITIGTSCVCSPIVLASTSSCSPVHCGACGAYTTCSTAPITCGSTCLVGGNIKGSIISGSTCMYSPVTCGTICVISPFVCGSTKVQSPILTGNTCSIAPVTIGTSCVCSPVVLGSVNICSPTVCSSTCLCSTGTARFTGAVTDASTLNVSGITKFASSVCLISPPPYTGTSNYSVFWNCNSKRLAVYQVSGGSTNYYYKECATICCTTSASCIKYIGFTGTSMPAGIYQIDFSEQVGQSNSNATVYGAFKLDGVTQGSDFLLKMNQAGFTFTNTLSRDVSLASGTHCFDGYYWAGGGTACATFASIRIRKV